MIISFEKGKDMNVAILMGRLTKDPETRYTQGKEPLAVTRYTLAVDRRYKRDGEPSADYIPCVAFGKGAEFANRYFKKGLRVTVSGRIQTGSYTNKDGQKIYTTEVIVDGQEFADSKQDGKPAEAKPDADGFMNIPVDIDAELPFA